MRLTPNAGSSPPEEGVVEYVMECESGGTMDIYVEPQIPKPQLLVVGDSPVAAALRALGRVLDYRIVVVAPGAKESEFPGADQIVQELERIPDLLTPETYAVVASDSPIRVMHAGRTYLFCSEGCRARFVKSPNLFLA